MTSLGLLLLLGTAWWLLEQWWEKMEIKGGCSDRLGSCCVEGRAVIVAQLQKKGRICPAEFVEQDLCSRVGDTGLSCRFVQQDLFNRLCTEVLQDLWCRICPAGLVQQDLSCRVCPPGSVLQGFYSSCPGGPALPWQQQFCSCCLCTQVPTAPAQVEVTSLLLEGWESCPVCYSPSSGM